MLSQRHLIFSDLLIQPLDLRLFYSTSGRTQTGQLIGHAFAVFLLVQSTGLPSGGLHLLFSLSLGHFLFSLSSRQCAAQVAWQFFLNALAFLHFFDLHLDFLSLQHLPRIASNWHAASAKHLLS